MWGYYAENGTGFALSYDLRLVNLPHILAFKVIYGDERFDAMMDFMGLIIDGTLAKGI